MPVTLDLNTANRNGRTSETLLEHKFQHEDLDNAGSARNSVTDSQGDRRSSTRGSWVGQRSSFVKDERDIPGLKKNSYTGEIEAPAKSKSKNTTSSSKSKSSKNNNQIQSELQDNIDAIQALEQDKPEEKIGSINCMFMLFSGAMGGGVLGLPSVVKHNGFFFGAFLICFGGIFSAASEYYLIKCTRVANENLRLHGKKPLSSYSSLMEYAAARCWPNMKSTAWVKLMLNIIFVIYLWFGVIVGNTIFLFKFTGMVLQVPDKSEDYNGFQSFVLQDTASGTQLSWIVCGFLALLWIPLCIPKDMSILNYISKYPFAVIMTTVCFTVVAVFTIPNKVGLTQPEGFTDYNLTIPVFFRDSGSIVSFFLAMIGLCSRFVFAYMTHTNVVTCAAALENDNDKEALKISIYNVVVIAFFYTMIAVLTTMVAGQDLGIPFLKWYTLQDEAENTKQFATIWAAFFWIMMLVGIPMNFPPLRSSCYEIYLHFANPAAVKEDYSFSSSSDSDTEKTPTTVVEGKPIFKNSKGNNIDDEATESLLPKTTQTVTGKPITKKSDDNTQTETASGSSDMTFLARLIVTVSLIVSGITMAKITPGVNVVIDFCGGSLATFVMIMGPGFMMRSILGKSESKWNKVWSWLFLAYTVLCLAGFFLNQITVAMEFAHYDSDKKEWSEDFRNSSFGKIIIEANDIANPDTKYYKKTMKPTITP